MVPTSYVLSLKVRVIFIFRRELKGLTTSLLDSESSYISTMTKILYPPYQMMHVIMILC